jgi:hypothetical protein
MTKLRHCTGFDLTNALTSEVEVFANFFESARFAAVETETKFEDLALAFVEW